jgi:uncharacterized membrane protein
MSQPIAPAVYVHLTAALCALVVGIVQMVRAKGTASHKALGRVWVTLMFIVAISSLWLPSFLHFTWIHLFTLVTLIVLPRAIWLIRHGDVAGHARAMRNLFLGALVVAGLFTLMPGRLLGNLLWKGVWG